MLTTLNGDEREKALEKLINLHVHVKFYSNK